MYGSHLAHHLGFDHVTYIMDEKRYEKYKGSTVTCNGEKLSFTCVPASQAVPADLVIVAVKSTGLTEALDTMKKCIGPDTVILSVMNGISSEEIILSLIHIYMNKKETLEIRKQFTNENCAITRICGCYVDAEKQIRTELKEAFLSLPEEEIFKYYEIFKKTLSGTCLLYTSRCV